MAVGNRIEVDHDKIVTGEIHIGEEIKGVEKEQLLTGISVSERIVETFKNGKLAKPAPGVSSRYDLWERDPNVWCMDSLIDRDGTLANNREIFNTRPPWPPAEFTPTE